MQSFLTPDLIQRVHEHKIQTALQRNYPEHHRYYRDNDPANGYVMSFRKRLGRWLVAAGTHVAQDRSPVTRSHPIGGVAIAGGTDRW